MHYFFAIAIIIAFISGRNPLKCLDEVKFRYTLVIIGSLLSQVILFVFFRLNPVHYAYLFEATLISLIVSLWFNRNTFGIKWIFSGATLNLMSLLLNGGRMPVLRGALDIAQISYASDDARHQLIQDSKYWFLGDWIPLYKLVLSIGDICVGIGIVVFVLNNSPPRRTHETS
ncbi:DUF5317 domain-containing protein [Gorillibacterium sp. sgz5001074]|uniref:DUF5317 domain-containing protein n=1 Tax=Gorillibacterium sp. sgz5001074 TaxID=3446695 RepID=UPI003F678CFB